MTTAVYNRQSLGAYSDKLLLPNIEVRVESDANPAQIALFLSILAGEIKKRPQLQPVTWTADDYYRNQQGDEYAYCNELGFERSYMGARADFNHIF